MNEEAGPSSSSRRRERSSSSCSSCSSSSSSSSPESAKPKRGQFQRKRIKKEYTKNQLRKEFKKNAVKEMSLLMGVPTKDIARNCAVVKGQYRREERKVTDRRTGKEAIAEYTTKWFAFRRTKIGTSDPSQAPQSPSENVESNESRSSSPSSGTRTPPQTSWGRARRNARVSRARALRDSAEGHDITKKSIKRYTAFIIEHLGKIPRHLQSKARYEINRVLFRYAGDDDRKDAAGRKND